MQGLVDYVEYQQNKDLNTLIKRLPKTESNKQFITALERLDKHFKHNEAIRKATCVLIEGYLKLSVRLIQSV